MIGLRLESPIIDVFLRVQPTLGAGASFSAQWTTAAGWQNQTAG